MANTTAGQGKQSPFRLQFKFWLNMDKPEEELIADKIEGLKKDRSFTSVIRDGIRLICDLREGKLDVLFELFPWVRAEFLEYMREIAPTPTQSDYGNRDTQPAPTNQQIETERAWLEAEQERIAQERAWEERRLAEAKQALEAERQQMAEERKHIEAERQRNQSSMQNQLKRIEEMLLQQGNQPIEQSGIGLKASGLRPIGDQQIQGVGLKGIKSKTTFEPPPFDDDDDIPELTISKAKSDGSATQNFLNSMKALQQQ